jgi:hypothetical protein
MLAMLERKRLLWDYDRINWGGAPLPQACKSTSQTGEGPGTSCECLWFSWRGALKRLCALFYMMLWYWYCTIEMVSVGVLFTLNTIVVALLHSTISNHRNFLLVIKSKKAYFKKIHKSMDLKI